MTEKKCDHCESMHDPIYLEDPSMLEAAKTCFGENRADVLARRLAVELFFHWYASIKPGSKTYEDLLLICRGSMKTMGSHHMSICFTNDLMAEVNKSLNELHSYVLSWPDLLLEKYPNKEEVK